MTPGFGLSTWTTRGQVGSLSNLTTQYTVHLYSGGGMLVLGGRPTILGGYGGDYCCKEYYTTAESYDSNSGNWWLLHARYCKCFSHVTVYVHSLQEHDWGKEGPGSVSSAKLSLSWLLMIGICIGWTVLIIVIVKIALRQEVLINK